VEDGVAESRRLRLGGDLLEHRDRFGMRSSKAFTWPGSGIPVAGSCLNASRRS
jgi:hypothetical protein